MRRILNPAALHTRLASSSNVFLLTFIRSPRLIFERHVSLKDEKAFIPDVDFFHSQGILPIDFYIVHFLRIHINAFVHFQIGSEAAGKTTFEIIL